MLKMPKALTDQDKRKIVSAVSMIQICEKFGYTYAEFIEQPWFFIETIDNYYRALADTQEQKQYE
jgi:hypothetical protein